MVDGRRPTDGDSQVLRETALLTVDGETHELTRATVRPRALEGLRHPGRGPERLAAPRRGAAGGPTYWVVDLDSTNGVEGKGKRVKRLQLEDGTRFTIGATEIAFSLEARLILAVPVDAAQVETTLLALKFAFLVLLYLFIWRIVRFGVPRPAPAAGVDDPLAAAGRAAPSPAGRQGARARVVVSIPALKQGAVYPID